MKTNELIDVALDWAVSKCEGNEINIRKGYLWIPKECYSTDWAQGGPIIERESISILCTDDYEWVAGYGTTQWDRGCPTSPTPLIAAMRCYVASKMGDDIEIPQELAE